MVPSESCRSLHLWYVASLNSWHSLGKPTAQLSICSITELVASASTEMHEIHPSHVKETSTTCSLVINWIQKRLCLWQRRLFMFVHHYASHEVSYGMLTKVCRARINYLKLWCFLHYPLTVWSYIFTGCSQGGKVTFGYMLCTFKLCGTDGFNVVVS